MKAIKNLGSLIFGAVLMSIGLVAYFYETGSYSYSSYTPNLWLSSGYPYQTLGIILIVAGIVFVGLGLFYSPRKTNNLPPPP
jgi:hypothetical protein